MNEDNLYYEFKDLPDKTTPLKSETLNAIQKSIKNDIKDLNNNITDINDNLDSISNMVISINRSKADANSVYTKKESDNKYANAIKEKITKVKEGQINSTGANLQDVQFFGESVQETEPSVDNPSPITSITGTINYKTTGKNIFDGEMELGSINWATGEFEDNANCIRSKNYTEVVEGQYYAFSNSRNYTHNVYNYDKNKQFISAEAVANNTSYQITTDVKYIRFRTTQGTVENNLDTGFQIEKGSTVTSFEPYKEKRTTIQLPEGEELCSLPNGVVDCVDSTGVIHKKILKIALGTQNWSIYQSEANLDRYYCFTSDVDSLIKEYPTQNTYNFCNIAQSVEMLLTSTEVDKDSFCIGYQGAARLRFMLKKDVIDAQEGDTLSAKLNNLFISKNAYILAENIEETTQNLAETEKAKMQNLETFEGINNITSNAPISAVYNTDTKSYIDSKFNTLAQQISNMVGGN